MSTLPPVRLHHPWVAVDEGILGGSPVVQGTKVPVRRIWFWHRRGVSVETLVKRWEMLPQAKPQAMVLPLEIVRP